jgi:ribosome-binding factor A
MNRLSDPRIEGFVSVTKVDVSPDLRNASVYLSVMMGEDKVKRRTIEAIEHATRYIQSLLSQRLTTKFCPHLQFKQDYDFKKTLETLRIIDEVRHEFEENEAGNNDDIDEIDIDADEKEQ